MDSYWIVHNYCISKSHVSHRILFISACAQNVLLL